MTISQETNLKFKFKFLFLKITKFNNIYLLYFDF